MNACIAKRLSILDQVAGARAALPGSSAAQMFHVKNTRGSKDPACCAARATRKLFGTATHAPPSTARTGEPKTLSKSTHRSRSPKQASTSVTPTAVARSRMQQKARSATERTSATKRAESSRKRSSTSARAATCHITKPRTANIDWRRSAGGPASIRTCAPAATASRTGAPRKSDITAVASRFANCGRRLRSVTSTTNPRAEPSVPPSAPSAVTRTRTQSVNAPDSFTQTGTIHSVAARTSSTLHVGQPVTLASNCSIRCSVPTV